MQTHADGASEAQQKGYAETNPASDVNGSDAEAKLLLLSLVGFGLQLQPGKSGAKESKIFKRSIFATPAVSATAPSSSSRWRGEAGAAGAGFVSPALVPGENFLGEHRRRNQRRLFRRQKQQRRARRTQTAIMF